MKGLLAYGNDPGTGLPVPLSGAAGRSPVISTPANRTTRYRSNGSPVSGVLKVGPGVFWGGRQTWLQDPSKCLMLFDSATVPAAGALPFAVTSFISSTASRSGTVPRSFDGTEFANGLSWALSTSVISLVTTGIGANSAVVQIYYL